MVTALRRLFRLPMSSPYTTVKDEIRGFQKLRQGWNSYSAPGISTTAIKWALEVVDSAERRGAPAPLASPTPSGGVALAWTIRDLEIELLIDEESFDYSVARRGDPKLIEQSSLSKMRDVEHGLIDKYLVAA